jgi:peptidoglycan/xylan/chitin deacetylase (PgdA/CDA1 family)
VKTTFARPVLATETASQIRVLAYHELSLQQSKDVYRLQTSVFRQHIAEALEVARQYHTKVEFTFDDADASQIGLAAPILETQGSRGIFFVPVAWIGVKVATANWDDLRALITAGHTIGSHSLTHAYLSQCTPFHLHNELIASRAILEDRLGVSIHSISAPGGRWNARVADACMLAGYRDLYISEPTLSKRVMSNPDGFRLTIHGRLVVRRSMKIDLLAGYINGRRPIATRLRYEYAIKSGLQRAFGDTAYRFLWRSLLRDPQ